MKKIFLVFIFLTTSIFAMSDKELAVTINLAGKQRMLTQKMSKEALLMFLGLDLDNSRKNLKASKELFDKTLKGLINGDKELGLVATKDEKIQSKLKEVQKLWEPFKKNIEAIYNYKAGDEEYEYIEENNLNLLKTMNEAVVMYSSLNKSSSKFKLANDINLAGRQRMLTQRIAKDALQYILNLDREETLEDLKKSINMFNETLDGLFNGSKKLHLHGTKLPRIVNQLNIVKSKWSTTEPLVLTALKPENIQNQQMTKEMIDGLDEVKKQMNKAVVYYTQSLNRQKQIMKLNALINGFNATKDNSKHVVNLAGKQRMLTQRISKLAIECKTQIIPEACDLLEKYINLYDKTLKGFKNGDSDLNLTPTKSKEALAQIDKIDKLWQPFKKAAMKVRNSKGKDLDSLKFILANNEELLKQSDKLVKIFEQEGAKRVSYIEKALLKIVNIAGRQRMLTQKMTKEKLAIISLKMTNFKEKMEKSVKLFDISLNGLIGGNKELGLPKATNKTIKNQLEKVSSIWKQIKPFYAKEKLSKKELTLLLKANPILLNEMNKAVGIIEKSTDY